MTVKELLSAYTTHNYVDVCIFVVDHDYSHEYDFYCVAEWNHENHRDWYCGQLDYFSTYDNNELVPYFGSEVRSFEVVYGGDIDRCPIVYITIK